MAALGAVAGIIGTVVSAVGTIAAGRAARQDAEFQAKQFDIQAKQERAAGYREAEEVARRKRIALSANQTAMAASGTAPLDFVDPINVDIAGYGADLEAAARAAADQRAKLAKLNAYAARTTGRAQQFQAYTTGFGTILGNFTNAFSQRYGGGGFGGTGYPYNSVPRQA